MKTYEVVDRVAKFGPGQVFRLKPEQAAPRNHQLETLDEKGGIYRATAPLQFKAREVLGVDGRVPKSMAEHVMPPEKAAETRAAKAKKAPPQGKAEAGQ